MSCRYFWPFILNYDKRSTNSTTVSSYMNTVMVMIDMYAYEFRYSACASHPPKVRKKFRGVTGDSKGSPVYIYYVGARRIELVATNGVYVFPIVSKDLHLATQKK